VKLRRGAEVAGERVARVAILFQNKAYLAARNGMRASKTAGLAHRLAPTSHPCLSSSPL